MKQANATFSIMSWNRSTWGEHPTMQSAGVALLRIEVKVHYHGDLEGEGVIFYLLAENGDNTGGFVGLEKVTGSVAGRSGSFVFQHTGTFDNGRIVDTLIVLPGSGEGSLRDISGTVMFDYPLPLETYPFTFHFEV